MVKRDIDNIRTKALSYGLYDLCFHRMLAMKGDFSAVELEFGLNVRDESFGAMLLFKDKITNNYLEGVVIEAVVGKSLGELCNDLVNLGRMSEIPNLEEVHYMSRLIVYKSIDF